MLALRITLIALLLGLLVRPPLQRPRRADSLVEIGPEAGLATLPMEVSDFGRGVREITLVRRSTEPPTIAELERIELLGGTLYAALPSTADALDVTAPELPRVDRASQIAWRLVTAPGSSGVVRLSDDAGALDSTTFVAGPDGSAAGGFRVRPGRPGWQEWTVGWDGAAVRTGAWVLPSEPLHALVVSPAGSVEGRDVARALEATGARVTLAQSLGRGLALGDAPTALPTSADALSQYSVVLVLSTGFTPAQLAALRTFAESGGGVLAAGRSAASLPFVRAASAPPASGASVQASAEDIEWATPPEIPPLPAAELTTSLTPLEVASPAVTVAASTSGSSVLVLAQVGRGRMAALALEDTWLWGLQAGRGPELTAFWRGMVEWLDSGDRSAFVLSVEPERATPGASVVVRVSRLDETAPTPDALELIRPDGTSERLALAWDAGTGHASFVTDAEGVFAVRVVAMTDPANASSSAQSATLSAPVATHLAEAASSASTDAWTRLALLAASSGGEALSPDQLEERIADLTPPLRVAVPPIAWLALVLMIAVAEWTARRLRGMP